MNTRQMRAVVSGLLAAVVAGCGPTAYKITPIPIDEELQETIVYSDRGVLLPKIALIDLDGMILNARESSLLGKGENPTALVVEKLQKASRDPQVKAVVLRINSPGGGVTASHIIYRHVLELRNGNEAKGLAGKPVVTSMMDVAASGGYYIACGTNEIYAESSTITGSIGVLMLTFNGKGLLDKIGITTDAIKSGPNKDAGSPFRPMKPEERQIFQGMIDQFYGQFVDVVAKGRPKLTKDQICKLADGRVYSGRSAAELGLVDKIGSLDEAIDRARELAGVEKAKVVMYHRPVGYKGNIYSSTEPMDVQSSSSPLININASELLGRQGTFMYLWQP